MERPMAEPHGKHEKAGRQPLRAQRTACEETGNSVLQPQGTELSQQPEWVWRQIRSKSLQKRNAAGQQVSAFILLETFILLALRNLSVLLQLPLTTEWGLNCRSHDITPSQVQVIIPSGPKPVCLSLCEVLNLCFSNWGSWPTDALWH